MGEGLLYGMPQSFSNSADSVRDTLLERFKVAQPIISTQGASVYSATLTGMGVWQKAASVFADLDGLVSIRARAALSTSGAMCRARPSASASCRLMAMLIRCTLQAAVSTRWQ